MRNKDIVIVGAELAGSLAASMLGNASIDAILIDPQAVYPSDFRKFVSRINAP
jgi:2-polyprenyl-6-methoxyphenol hydroxylase-like FAD-dependent oxidoreductase